MERLFDCPFDKIDVIYNGVDPARFEFEFPDSERFAWRSKFARPDEKVVLFVGRFVREKGIQVLLNAASAILAQEPKTRFVLVGGGNREKFERFVHWSGLDTHVTFTGFMRGRDLHRMFRIADVAVFPSLYEPFGIVALEAMASGVPVVASDAGGLREVVIHDFTGTSSFANDSQSVAWAVLRVLKDQERSKRIVEEARIRLRTDFDWGYLAQRTAAVYDRVWSEFLDSYWAEGTLWPISEGAEDRAKRLRVKERALVGLAPGAVRATRPAPKVEMPADEAVDEERVSFREHEADSG